ncbi:hypothetical protein ACFZAR_42615 [Streptomyces sp. NPDC008222]|uniref:hypothetical protein n=1 Tax=Streptomyces sp. NPDC008222 TaxID=3364820 RepID=UPI0036E8BD3C
MSVINSQTSEIRGGFSLNSMMSDASPEVFDTFKQGWEARIGDGFRLPTFSATVKGNFRVKTRATRVHDAAITDVRSASSIQTSGAVSEVDDQVRIWVMRRGEWALDGTREHGQYVVVAGSLLLRHVGRPSNFKVAPHTEGKIVVLPADLTGP